MQDTHSASKYFSLLTNLEHIKPLKKNIKLQSRWGVLSLFVLFSFRRRQARME